jgi:hypothetical protein
MSKTSPFDTILGSLIDADDEEGLAGGFFPEIEHTRRKENDEKNRESLEKVYQTSQYADAIF